MVQMIWSMLIYKEISVLRWFSRSPDLNPTELHFSKWRHKWAQPVTGYKTINNVIYAYIQWSNKWIDRLQIADNLKFPRVVYWDLYFLWLQLWWLLACHVIKSKKRLQHGYRNTKQEKTCKTNTKTSKSTKEREREKMTSYGDLDTVVMLFHIPRWLSVQKTVARSMKQNITAYHTHTWTH